MYIKILLSITLFYMSLTIAGAQTNRALLIAIDKYEENSGWNDIHATNDVELIYPMLIEKGYKKQNIVSLLNDNATKLKIVNEFKKLLNVSRAGDYLYIHFSCHGQLMADDNGDEPDGYDEAMIPYNAKRRYTEGIYEGENHLRDDELRIMLDNIRDKIGKSGDLTVVFDACHSATADRNTDDQTYIRGTTYIFAPDNYTPTPIDPKKVIYKPKTGENMAPFTILSACGATQINYEYKAPNGKYYGTLTYALHSILSANKAAISTNDLFNQTTDMVKKMTKGKKQTQTPYLQTTHEDQRFNINR